MTPGEAPTSSSPITAMETVKLTRIDGLVVPNLAVVSASRDRGRRGSAPLGHIPQRHERAHAII